jgi:amino acid transporter
LGGKTFKTIGTIIGLISSIGLFNVILCTSSRSLFAMAPDDMLGWQSLAKIHPRFKTPWVSILANSLCVFFLSILPFQELVEVGMYLLLFYFLFVK